MLNAHFKPLHQWSGPRTQAREEGRFKASWLQILDLLEFELGKLRAKDIVIQIEDPEAIKGIRNDGSMRIASEYYTPNKAGVILTFDSPKGNISMPADKYANWRHNLRAIALSLEALRAVDRYGVTRGNEQYRGWARLEAPPNGYMDKDQSASFIAGILQISPAEVLQKPAEHIRAARFRTHPDRSDGDLDKFTKIGQAEEVLCGS